MEGHKKSADINKNSDEDMPTMTEPHIIDQQNDQPQNQH